MPEFISDKQVFSLLEVTKSIQKTLSERYRSAFWVKAEMNKLNFYRQSGHCYPELLEKKDGFTIAQIKATLWRDDFFRINGNFQRVLKEPLKDGIKILFFAAITFDPVHGLSLNILDIDPSYTLGDLEREKQDTIRQLKEEGIYYRNKQLNLPLLPQRIAIISVQTSKGYADFLRVVDENPWKYRFFHYLFPSLLQGDNAVDSIIAQLKQVQKVKEHFDVVAITRGGGGDVGLSCYNNYRLAKEIAMFPIPVLTGIGHATNETVSEMVSFANAITPTKLAEYLIQKFHDFAFPVQDAERIIVEKSGRILSDASATFQSEVKLFRSVTENLINENKNDIRELSTSIFRHAKFFFRNETDLLTTNLNRIARGVSSFCSLAELELKGISMNMRKDASLLLGRLRLSTDQFTNRLSFQANLKLKSSLLELNSIEKNVSNMSPANVLRRGYSITMLDGKAVSSVSQLKNGDAIKTLVFDGEVSSTITSTSQSTES